MPEASDGTENETFERLLSAFRAVDAKDTGRMERERVALLLGRLGFESADAEQLLDGSNCCSSGEVDYRGFLHWLVTGAGASKEILDAGAEQAAKPLASATCGFGAWTQRCARLLEARGEADYVQKRLVAAQVRAHLLRLAEAEAETPPPVRSQQPRSKSPSLFQGEPQAAPALRWDGPALLERFLHEGPAGLPRDYVAQVLAQTAARLPRLRPQPLVRLRVPEGGRVVVVGDTHGQLQDVLLIMLLHGLPSPTNIFLFNGDVADRGPNASEIFLLIFTFFLSDPGTVFLTRGNHEDEHMNMMSADSGGGFFDECKLKYGEPTYWRFVDIFKLLPLAAVVNEEVFIVHGGLPRDPPPSLDELQEIKHTETCCPEPDTEDVKEGIFLDLVWSDPIETPGHKPNPRGAGCLWGPDLTKAFLQRNGLRWVIRSHELPWDGERGWMEHHLGLVFTVFSASNYCGYEVNWGAVALLTTGADGRLEQALREHNVGSLGDLAGIARLPEGKAREERCLEMGLSWVDSDRVAVGERRVKLALRRLAGLVLEFKPELWKKLRDSDPKNLGLVKRDKWVESLVKVCGDDLPWQEACKCWAPEEQEDVDYRQFLRRFKVVLAQERWCGWKSLVIADVYEELLDRHATAEEMVRTFDPSGDGVVSEGDFMALMQECSGGRLSEPQIAALTRTIFAHAQGRGLQVSKFLSRFTLAFVQSKGMSPVEQQSPLTRYGPTLDQIGKLIVRARVESQHSTPRMRALERFVSQPPCRVTAVDGATSLETSVLGPPPVPLDLSRAASAVPAAPAPLGDREPSSALLHAFELFNDARDGLLQVDEFVRHVGALPGIAEVRHKGEPLDAAVLREIGEALAEGCGAPDKPGTISLLQFAQAFAVVDESGSTDLADDLHEHILTFLWRHQHALRSSCAELDSDGLGRVSRRDFARVLEAVNFCTARPARHLTRMQMSVLAESVTEEDGSVEYEAFLSSLEVHAE